jgi:hypothetical protein
MGCCSKISGLDKSEAGFTPSPLRGEGRDEEWFDSTLNATNPTPHPSLPLLKGEGAKSKPHPNNLKDKVLN